MSFYRSLDRNIYVPFFPCMKMSLQFFGEISLDFSVPQYIASADPSTDLSCDMGFAVQLILHCVRHGNEDFLPMILDLTVMQCNLVYFVWLVFVCFQQVWQDSMRLGLFNGHEL